MRPSDWLRPARALALVVVAACVVGCAGTRPPAALAGSVCGPRMLDRLFFGLSRPDGGVVSDGEWQAFLATVVTPRFPAGLTVLSARGQWQDQVDGAVGGEDARVVEILHADSATASAAVAAIVADYKTRFAQQAVLVVRSRVESCL